MKDETISLYNLNEPKETRRWIHRPHKMSYKSIALLGSLALNMSFLWIYRAGSNSGLNSDDDPTASLRDTVVGCQPPLPTLLTHYAPSSSNKHIIRASNSFSKELEAFAEDHQFDAMSVAIVDASGLIYDNYQGVLRANETEKSKRSFVDRNSIYRIASITKMFTALETMMLRDASQLNLDDPITKYLPDFSYLPQSPADGIITFRQLMSHMSGLGRDFPPGDATGHWPESIEGQRPSMPTSTEEFFKTVAAHHLISATYNYPIYSNTGFSLLGLANVAANAKSEGDSAPKTYEELMKRDVFDRLGMNGSSFVSSDANRPHLVVASIEPEGIDVDMNARNAAGGQYSSMSDLVKVAHSFLSHSHPGRLLSESTMREWLKPVYNDWDGRSGFGMVWEMTRVPGESGKTLELYRKRGDHTSHHSSFSIIPTHSFISIVLFTGAIPYHLEIDDLIMKHFGPAFESALIDTTQSIMGGKWESEDGRVQMNIGIERGSLYVYRYVINGTDALVTLNYGIAKTTKVQLWSTGNDEFKLAPGYEISAEVGGCLAQSAVLDRFGYMNGYPINLVQLRIDKNDFKNNILSLPSIKVNLTKNL